MLLLVHIPDGLGDFDFLAPGTQKEHVDQIRSLYGIPKADLTTWGDPFDIGTVTDWEKARWFMALYAIAGGKDFVGHLRDMHYAVNALRPDLYDGSDDAWQQLMEAKRMAVALGLLAPDALDDRSISSSWDATRYGVEAAEPFEPITIPEAGDYSEPCTTTVYPAAVSPFDLLVWVEKPSPALHAEIQPQAARFGGDVRYGRGTPSQGFVAEAIRLAAERGRELVLIVVSDADSTGETMGRSMAKQAELLVRAQLIEDAPRVRLARADFSMRTVHLIEERLGRTIPRTEDAKGAKRVELQALPQFQPGLLGQLVEQAIVDAVGDDYLDRIADWEADLDEALRTSEQAEQIEQLHDEYATWLETPEAQALVEQLRQFEERRAGLVEALQAIVDEADPVEADEPGDVLLDTERTFMEQLQAYRRHDGLPEFEFEAKTCEHCGGPVTGARADARFCSIACRDAARAARLRAGRALAPRPCAQCGTSFTPKRSDGRFCSPRCSRASRRGASPEASA